MSTTTSNKRAKTSTIFPQDSISGSSTTKKFEVVSKANPTIRLFNHNHAEEGSIEFGLANPKCAILLARYEGKVYVGDLYKNPGSFDENGVCLEQHTTGVTMTSLLHILSDPEKHQLIFSTSPIENWNAWFNSNEAPSGGALSFRVFITAPFVKTPLHTFQADLVMHELIGLDYYY
jgi:hypothetical protein